MSRCPPSRSSLRLGYGAGPHTDSKEETMVSANAAIHKPSDDRRERELVRFRKRHGLRHARTLWMTQASPLAVPWGGRACLPLGLDVRSQCRPRARSRCFREMFVCLRRGLARALGLRGGGVSASKSSTTAKGSHFGWPKAKRKTHDEAGY